MDGCKNIKKPVPSGTSTLSSRITWDGGYLCIDGKPLNGKDLNYVIGLISQSICDNTDAINNLVFPTPPVLEESIITNVNPTLIDADANFVSATYFQFAALGYNTLEYTNSSGSTKTYIVNSYANIGTSAGGASYGYSDVDMGIFKRAGGDTLVSEVIGTNQINFVGTGAIAPEDVTNAVYVSEHSSADVAQVTLQDGESVLLKFKSKGGASGFLKKATLHIREKHN